MAPSTMQKMLKMDCSKCNTLFLQNALIVLKIAALEYVKKLKGNDKYGWRHDTSHNGTKHDDIQHNYTQPIRLKCDTQHNDALPLC
jgi:hypothetical protein